MAALQKPQTTRVAATLLAKHKERSHKTLRDVQLPSLRTLSQSPEIVLLGDSIIERMLTTGQWNNLDTWPSEAMLTTNRLNAMNDDRASLEMPQIRRLRSVVNAGCGGDRIQNVLYRLAGDTSQAANEPIEGLLDAFEGHCENVKLWIVHAGTNNLGWNKELSSADVGAMRVLLLSLFSVSAPNSRVLVTGLFYRKDIPNRVVDESNAQLEQLVMEMAAVLRRLPAKVPLLSLETEPSSLESHSSAATESCHEGSVQVEDAQTVGTHIEPAGVSQASRRNPKEQPFLNYWTRSNAKTGEEAGSITSDGNFIDFLPTQSDRIQFLAAPLPVGLGADERLEDHVHLNLHGYGHWMSVLLPKAMEMLDAAKSKVEGS